MTKSVKRKSRLRMERARRRKLGNFLRGGLAVLALAGVCGVLMFLCLGPIGSRKNVTSQSPADKTGADLTGTGETDPPGGSGDCEADSAWNGNVIFRYSEISSDTVADSDGMQAAFGGEYTYLYQNKRSVETDGSTVYNLFHHTVVRIDGGDVNSGTVIWEENERLTDSELWRGEAGCLSVDAMTADENGNLFLSVRHYYPNEGNRVEYTVVAIDPDGQKLWSAVQEHSVSNLACANGTLCMSSYNILTLFGADGEKKAETNCGDYAYIRYLLSSRDGRVFACVGSTVGSPYAWAMSEVDLETGEIGPEMDSSWAEGRTESSPGGGSGYDFLLLDTLSVYGYRLGDRSCTEVLNFIDSDLNRSDLIKLFPLDPDHFLALFHENSAGTAALLSRVPSGSAGKKTVTMAWMGTSDILQDVLRFNRDNGEYRVKLLDYSWEGGRQQLDLDVVSGKVPDLFLINGSSSMMMAEDYTRQGVLEDLYPWIDGDAEFSRGDFLTNVFEAYETDGALYQLPTAFEIETYVGDASIFGGMQGWSFEDMQRIAAEHPDKPIFSTQQRSYFLKNALEFGQFADYVKGTCSFDSDNFIETLELAAQFPEQVDYDHRFSGMLSSYTLSEIVGSGGTFTGFDGLSRQFDGEDYVFVGFPGAPGNGSLITDGRWLFAMSSVSRVKEGAWAFIRQYLGEEYQRKGSQVIGGFPVRAAVLEELSKEAFVEATYTGGKDTDTNIYTRKAYTRAEVNGMLDFIRSVNRRGKLDLELYTLICEEADSFFAGQKSAAEVAEIIQGRAWIYLEEQKN